MATEPSGLDWFEAIASSVTGLAVVGVSIASVLIARASHRLAENAQSRETAALAARDLAEHRVRREEIVRDASAWVEKRFAVPADPSDVPSPHDWFRLSTTLLSCGLEHARTLESELDEIKSAEERADAKGLQHDARPLAAGAAAAVVALWARDPASIAGEPKVSARVKSEIADLLTADPEASAQ